MDKQLIITIGREFGSGGHLIAEELAKRFNLPLYDHNLLEIIATEKNANYEELKKYDELPINRLLSRRVKGHSNSMQDNVAKMQMKHLVKMAKENKSFVVVGRCAEYVLKDFPSVISFFVLGDFETKLERVMSVYNLPEDVAESKMTRHDTKRKAYHNYYCDIKWGDSRAYDICVNSSRLGIEKTVDMLEEYIRNRLAMED